MKRGPDPIYVSTRTGVGSAFMHDDFIALVCIAGAVLTFFLIAAQVLTG